MLNRTTPLLLLALTGLILAHGGCSLFAGSASMRIEVEVYKGPLSKEPELQWKELTGLVHEHIEIMQDTKKMIESFSKYGDVFKVVDEASGKTDVDWEKCDLGWFNLSWFKVTEIPNRGNCLILASLREDATTLESELQFLNTQLETINLRSTLPAEIKKSLEQVAAVSAEASAKAFNWSISSIAGAPLNPLYRIVLVHFSVHCSEIGKQLNARADTLLKQMDGLDRRELPLSVQLRETDPTEFLQLYDWFGAHAGQIARFFQPGSVTDRTKAVRRLFADHNWSNINTVYASGWGKGSMALIKDDIGNWNLKSFDSDPEDLLRAYKNATITAIETAGKAAKAGFTGGSGAAADKLLDMASQYFSPSATMTLSASADGQFRLLNERTSLKLRELKDLTTSQKEEEARANDEYKKAVKDLIGKKQDDPDYAKLEKSVQDTKKVLIARRMETIQSIEKILNEHGELIDMLAKGAIGN